MIITNLNQTKVFIFFLSWFILLLPLGLEAQNAEKNMMVGVNHSPFEGDRNGKIENILNRTAIMELEQSGLKGVLLQDSPQETSPELKLTGHYLQQQDMLQIEYELEEAATGKQIAEIQINTALTHFLDRAVANAVKDLLQKGRDEIERIAQAKQQQDEQQQDKQERETGAVAERADSETEQELKPDHQPGGVLSEVKFSGSSMFGRASEYMPYGLLIEGRFSYPLVQKEEIAWRIGGTVGVIRFLSAVEYKAGYVKTLVPLGVLTELQLSKKSNWTFRGWWTAGAALRLPYQDEVVDKLLAPALPYTNMGIGALVPLGADRLRLAVGISGMGLFHLYEEPEGDAVKVEPLLGMNFDLGIVWRM